MSKIKQKTTEECRKNREKYRKPRKTVKNLEERVKNRQKYRKIV